jgi:CRP-like cAMP-binding protein
MESSERIRLLQATPFFGAVADKSIDLILHLSETLEVEKGDYFFHQGDYGDSLFLLERGQAVVFKKSQDQEYPLRYVKDGDCFGELALIDFSPRSASVRAEIPSTAIKIPSSALHKLYQQNTEQFLIIQMNMAREVSRRLRDADNRWFNTQVSGVFHVD